MGADEISKLCFFFISFNRRDFFKISITMTKKFIGKSVFKQYLKKNFNKTFFTNYKDLDIQFKLIFNNLVSKAKKEKKKIILLRSSGIDSRLIDGYIYESCKNKNYLKNYCK